MSADPPSSSGSPDSDKPQKPDAQKEVTEADDLWNLDEDLPAKPSAAPTPRAAIRKPGLEEISPDTPASAEKNVQRAKTKSRLTERPKEQAFTPPSNPRTTPDEIGDLEDRADEAEEEENAVLVVLPEDEEEAPTPASVPVPAPAPPPSEAPVAEEAAEQDLFADETDEAGDPGDRPSSASLDPALKSSEEPRRNRPKAPDKAGNQPSRRDVITLGSFAFLLLLAVIWVISRFFTQLSFESDIVKMPDYPVKGEHATISTADTYWREPVREGANRDVARREVAMIPVLDITLDKDKSTAGALRIIFRNSEGAPIGDSITRAFSSGRFDASGNPTIAFPSTDGFLDEGSFNGYRTRPAKPWMADVMEGPSVDAPAGSFKKLVQIPVIPQRR